MGLFWMEGRILYETAIDRSAVYELPQMATRPVHTPPTSPLPRPVGEQPPCTADLQMSPWRHSCVCMMLS